MRASSAPCGRGSKNQKFSLPFFFSSAGSVGGEEAWDASARKDGKEIFGFASPLQTTKRAILF